MSLVADYGTSSESDSDTTDSDSSSKTKTEDEDSNQILLLKNTTEKLPGPAFGNSSTSVFSNPFIEAENAKKAILEKHVKMVPTKEETNVINGKKICWNYRKGRCRFGHNCTFAHDSDLQKSAEKIEEENKIQTTVICQNNQNKNQMLTEPSTIEVRNNQNDDLPTKNKKKRPGLSQGLVPGKKVMKLFHKQEKTSTWSTHR